MSSPFIQHRPQPEDYWRSIIMFGRNVASYKFALGKTLLDLSPVPGQLVTLEELAEPFSAHMCKHLQNTDKQGTSPGSRFLDACRRANASEISRDELLVTTVQLGFNNVIEAFHVVGREAVDCPFFTDERRTSKGIRITDTFALLTQGEQLLNLGEETEARWRLVETAWELNVSRSLIAVNYDSDSNVLFTLDRSRRRKSIAGAREALSGYQKGHCFYCFGNFTLLGTQPPDVDHFFPHSLKSAGFGASVDGIWNLVLACQHCNRGAGGKSNHVPTLSLLERLSKRNEFLILSQHPLRETLIAQTGPDVAKRRAFLNRCHKEAIVKLVHEWEPTEVREPLF